MKILPPLDLRVIDDVLRAAVREDLGAGDITTLATIPEAAEALGTYKAKQSLVQSGLQVVQRLLEIIDPSLEFEWRSPEGSSLQPGSVLAYVRGSARSILSGERVTLNILQRMCGIATLTHEYVERVKGTKAVVADTRKTVPGLRILDKYAVACGGGSNHRMGLFDAILIKNNHLVFHSSIAEAIRMARKSAGPGMRIEVEIPAPEHVDAVIEAGADAILLDNFTVNQTQQAVRSCRGRVPLESSGGITLETIRSYAETGVDVISVGALTHSPPAVDIHLQVARSGPGNADGT